MRDWRELMPDEIAASPPPEDSTHNSPQTGTSEYCEYGLRGNEKLELRETLGQVVHSQGPQNTKEDTRQNIYPHATAPIPGPLQPGWRVCYYDKNRRLVTRFIQNTTLVSGEWIVTLETGEKLAASKIVSVTKFENGEWKGSWLVKKHGLDGTLNDPASKIQDPRNHTHNTQNPEGGGSCEYSEHEKPTPEIWEAAWQGLAELTNGLTKEDPGFPMVIDRLEECDSAFSANDWPAFQQSADEIKAIMSSYP